MIHSQDPPPCFAPRRPTLFPVLAALTGDVCWNDPQAAFLMTSQGPAFARVSKHPPKVGDFNLIPWRSTDPIRSLRHGTQRPARPVTLEEALWDLYERGLWPWEPRGPTAPRWCLRTVDGRLEEGTVLCTDPYGRVHAGGLGTPQGFLNGRGQLADPPTKIHDVQDVPRTFAALAAIASLGVEQLLRVGELAAQFERLLRVPCPVCGPSAAPPGSACGLCLGRNTVPIIEASWVWRVMSVDSLQMVHSRRDEGNYLYPLRIFSHERRRELYPRQFAGIPAWPECCPWTSYPFFRRTHTPTRSACCVLWPVLRSLALDTSVHLVDLSLQKDGAPARLVLGVPAL